MVVTIRPLTGGNGGSAIEGRLVISTKPNKMIYTEGEKLATTGMVVVYKKDAKADGEIITNYKVTPAHDTMLKRSDNVLKIEYDVHDETYVEYLPIEVKYPIGIEVVFMKDKYFKNEKLDTNSARIVVRYSDGSIGTLVHNNVTYTPAHNTNLGTVGPQLVTINYNIDNVSFKTYKQIEVMEKQPVLVAKPL